MEAEDEPGVAMVDEVLDGENGGAKKGDKNQTRNNDNGDETQNQNDVAGTIDATDLINNGDVMSRCLSTTHRATPQAAIDEPPSCLSAGVADMTGAGVSSGTQGVDAGDEMEAAAAMASLGAGATKTDNHRKRSDAVDPLTPVENTSSIESKARTAAAVCADSVYTDPALDQPGKFDVANKLLEMAGAKFIKKSETLARSSFSDKKEAKDNLVDLCYLEGSSTKDTNLSSEHFSAKSDDDNDLLYYSKMEIVAKVTEKRKEMGTSLQSPKLKSGSDANATIHEDISSTKTDEDINRDEMSSTSVQKSRFLTGRMRLSQKKEKGTQCEKQGDSETLLAAADNVKNDKDCDQNKAKELPGDDTSDSDEIEVIEMPDTSKRGYGGTPMFGTRRSARTRQTRLTNNLQSGESAKSTSKENVKQKPSASKQKVESQQGLDSDEDMTIGATQKSSPKRYPKRRRVSKHMSTDDSLDEHEVKFIFSSSPGRPAAKKSPNSTLAKNSLLRRSSRESTPPSKFQNFPLISSTTERGDGRANRNTQKNMCNFENCLKLKQSNCGGYCRAHFKDLPSINRDKSILGKNHEKMQRTTDSESRATSVSKSKKRKKINDGIKEPENLGRQKKECKADGCESWVRKSGFCASHYRKWLERNEPDSDGIDAHSSPSAKGGRDNDCKDSIRLEQNILQTAAKDETVEAKGSPGGVAVMSISSSTDDRANPLKCNISRINDGRENGNDECHLLEIGDKSDTKPKLDAEKSDEDDDFSFSELELSAAKRGDSIRLRRELELDTCLSSSSRDNQKHWRCSRCGDINSSKRSRCSTCRKIEGFNGKISESLLLEQTRRELLNGHDFWICTRCVIGIPSLTVPCGGCQKMISFVPLDITEFEAFVRKRREANGKRVCKWRDDWQGKVNELQEEWLYQEEDKTGHKLTVDLDDYKNNTPYGKHFCKYWGCKAIKQSNCRGFCSEHVQIVFEDSNPVPYPLVYPEDRALIFDSAASLTSALEYMVPCNANYLEKKPGFPGLCCKFCIDRKDEKGKALCRWFPSSENAMYAANFAKNIINHLQKCPRCPLEVKEKLKLADPAKDKTMEKALSVTKKGDRKKFIHRLWCRVQRLPLVETDQAEEHTRGV
mmetsp:Transcript_4403/g.9757  ORF Transcript_4403/g.9757 Transcript_4403/m.9757 type:complete len:1123 (+) Transcript_4403:109-3477(+)